MQGHRNHMEDRTVSRSHFSAKLKQFSLYIVFDGHGGDESANHAQAELADFLLKQGKNLFEEMENFKSYDVELAGLENCEFMRPFRVITYIYSKMITDRLSGIDLKKPFILKI